MSVSAVGGTQPVSSFDLTVSIQVSVFQVETPETQSISQGASLLGQLQQLQASNPSEFQTVMNQVAQGLRSQAQQASGGQAGLLDALADRFAAAAQAGNLSALSPSNSSSATSGSAATSAASSSSSPASGSGSSPSAGSAAASPADGAAGGASSSSPAVGGSRHHHRHHAHDRYGQGSSAGEWASAGILGDVVSLIESALASATSGAASALSSSTSSSSAATAPAAATSS